MTFTSRPFARYWMLKGPEMLSSSLHRRGLLRAGRRLRYLRCNYTELGNYTADMAFDILTGGAVPEFHVMDGGIITVNTDTAKALGIDYSIFSTMANTVVEVTTEQ